MVIFSVGRRKPISLIVGASLITTALVLPPPMPEYVAHAARAPRFDDNCKPLRQPFSRIKNEQTGRILGGVIAGALVGALLGSMVKKERVETDQYGRQYRVRDGNRAAEGAIAGAVAGGLTGYLTGIEQHRQNQQELQAALAGYDGERQQYSDLGQKLADLGNCRNQQIFDVRTQFEAGQFDAKEANSRLAKVEKWIADDNRTVERAADMEAKSITTYAQAVAVAEGESAESAKNNGAGMVSRYEAGSDRLKGDVDVSYESAETPIAPAVAAVEATSRSYVQSSRGANLRSSPSSSAAVLRSLPYRAQVETSPAEVQGWSKVTFEGQTGYVANSLLSDAQPVPRQAARPSAAPRPDIAPGKIIVRRPASRAPQQRRDSVTKAVADGQSLRAVDAARRTSNQRQLVESRSRIAAALQGART